MLCFVVVVVVVVVFFLRISSKINRLKSRLISHYKVANRYDRRKKLLKGLTYDMVSLTKRPMAE